MFQDKTSTVPEESVNLSIVAVPGLIHVHESLIDEHGAAGDLAQGAMGGTAVTSTPVSSRSVPNFNEDQNGTAMITRAKSKYLSHCSSCPLIFLSLSNLFSSDLI